MNGCTILAVLLALLGGADVPTNLLTNGDFETGDLSNWTVSLGSPPVDTNGHPNYAVTVRGAISQQAAGTYASGVDLLATWDAKKLDGTVQSLTLGLLYDGVAVRNLIIDVSGNAVVTDELGNVLSSTTYGRPENWQQYSITYTPTAGGTAAGVLIANLDASNGWVVDNATIGVYDMAVKLAERAIDELHTLLGSDLETELAAIDTDRSDSITTAGTTTTYYKYPRPVIAGGQTHIEIFESEFEFINQYSDADAERAVYVLPVTVRITFFNRDQDSQTNFVTRARRLAVGVFNVFNKKPTLAAADSAIQIVGIDRITPQWEVDGEDSTRIDKATMTLEMVVRCEETQA